MLTFIAVVALAELEGLVYVSCSTSLEKSTEYHRSILLFFNPAMRRDPDLFIALGRQRVITLQCE